jgi:hypothetical protein
MLVREEFLMLRQHRAQPFRKVEQSVRADGFIHGIPFTRMGHA